MNLKELIIPLGISTYTVLLLTILSGIAIFKFHIKWVNMKWHILLAVLTLVLASIHVGLVLF